LSPDIAAGLLFPTIFRAQMRGEKAQENRRQLQLA
jgi:hypothetical protein